MENKQNNKNDTWSALGLAWELGYLIVIPLVLFALGGRFLDKKLGTSPWMLIAGMLVAIVITSIIVYKKTVNILNDTRCHPERSEGSRNNIAGAENERDSSTSSE